MRTMLTVMLLAEQATLQAAIGIADEQPDIIFVLGDNLGNGHVARFNPRRRHRTPRPDRMAVYG